MTRVTRQIKQILNTLKPESIAYVNNISINEFRF